MAKQFDPKDFGSQIFGDAQRVYQQGPQVNPTSSYTPYSQQTQDLIGQGFQNNQDLRGGPIGRMAGGDFLGGGNPYLNAEIARTRENVSNDVNSTFASNGRFGSDIHAQGLAEGLGNAENTARFGQYNTDVGNMFQANTAVGNSTAQTLGYGGMLDSKAQQQTDANNAQWDAQNNAGYNHIAKYLGLLQGNGDATNKPLSLWDIIGAAGSIGGAFL